MGCAGANGNEEAKSPDSADQDAPKRTPMEELQAIPKELKAQADDLTKPIDDVQKVIDQLTSMPKRYGLDSADVMAMAQATLESGAINVKLGSDVSEAARTEVENALNTLKAAVTGLKNTPDKVAALVTKMATLAAKVPALAAEVTASATAAAANPFAGAEAKAKAKADLESVKQVQADVMKVVSDTRAKIVGVPAMATGALSKLMAALKGGGGGTDSDTTASAGADKNPGTGTTGGTAVAPSPGRKLAVVRVSMGANSALEARVRRDIDGVLASHGVDTVPIARVVDATLSAASSSQAPSTAQLDEGVRAALKAAVTVRVSRATDDSVRVSVMGAWPVTEKTKSLQASPDEMAAKVSAAVAELLEKDGFQASVPSATRRASATGGTTLVAQSTPPANPAGKGTSGPGVIDDGFGAAPQRAAPAATPADQVLLKDGTAIRGRVIKQDPGTFVTIETAEGAQRTIPWERVKEVVVVPKAR